MAYFVVCLVALIASGLTLFSGFGLGTLLLPAFALFFPVEIAVASTAIVHLLNNLFKLILVGRQARLSMVLGFGLPAIVSAFGGAWALTWLAGLPVLWSYSLGGHEFEVSRVKLVLALLILGFAVLDLLGARGKQRQGGAPRRLWIGGLLSGFFGGLSGHQGALRSAFLIREGVTRDEFIGTSVVCSVLVDLVRLGVYGAAMGRTLFKGDSSSSLLIGAATGAAFIGAFVGVRLVRKVTLGTVRHLVATLLIGLALAMGVGLV